MAERKFVSEFALNMVASSSTLIQQDALDHPELLEFNAENPCHIYMVHRCPRVILDADSVKFTDTEVTGTFRVQRGHEFAPKPFKIANQLGVSDARIDCPYPHSEYAIYDNTGARISWGKAALLAMFCGYAGADFLDLEILYIGQSYGVEGARTAPARLKAHSTLQNIYAEAMRRSPDMEVWLTLWSFQSPWLLMSFDGRKGQTISTTEEQDNAHMSEVMSSEVTEQQRINFTEAALIRYFRPPYNTEYKDTFPNPAHKTYEGCYKIDLNAVAVEIGSEQLGRRLWSSTVTRQWTHFISFPLHSTAERQSMFEFDI